LEKRCFAVSSLDIFGVLTGCFDNVSKGLRLLRRFLRLARQWL
jgi:hypothetical protein